MTLCALGRGHTRTILAKDTRRTANQRGTPERVTGARTRHQHPPLASSPTRRRGTTLLSQTQHDSRNKIALHGNSQHRAPHATGRAMRKPTDNVRMTIHHRLQRSMPQPRAHCRGASDPHRPHAQLEDSFQKVIRRNVAERCCHYLPVPSCSLVHAAELHGGQNEIARRLRLSRARRALDESQTTL